MKLCAILGSGILLLAILTVVLATAPVPGFAQRLSVPPQGPMTPDYQLLVNHSLETYGPPYHQYEGVNCQVASGWQRFWYDGPEPHWLDCRVFAASSLGAGWVESIHGDTSQLIISTEPYTAGLWQQVGGLTPGLAYGFHAALLTIFQTSAQDPVHGTMVKEVGIDPAGGTDPRSPQVVWSEPNGQDQGWDVTRITAAYAQAPTMTVFMRVTSPYPSGGLPLLNQSFFDSAILARTAVVSASSPSVSGTEHFEVRWDNAVPSPGGEIRWYDVEWLNEAEGVWHEWLTWTTDLTAGFDGQWGHRYRFRARAWQRYPNGAHLFSPFRPDGDTQTRVGPELTGRVLDPQARGLPGATVEIPETGQMTLSGPNGGFRLSVVPSPDPLSLMVSHPGWLAPPPLYGLTLAPTATVAVTWTMRPTRDALVNGSFEAGLEGWSSTLGAAAEAGTVHTGRGAALLAQASDKAAEIGQPFAATVSLSQTVVLTDAWRPALSFWYRDEASGEEEGLNVVLTVVTPTLVSAALDGRPAGPTAGMTTTRILTPTLHTEGRWRHFWSYVSLSRAALTGTVTVAFRLQNQAGGEPLAVYLDEVTLAATPGGPWQVYVPLVVRGQ